MEATFTFISFLIASFILLSHAPSSHKPHLNPRVFATDGGFYDNAISNLTKRATDTYDKARTKGNTLHCLMGMSQEDIEARGGCSLESLVYPQTPGLEEMEGWRTREALVAFFGEDLNEALMALNVPIDFYYQMWNHFKGDKDFYDDLTFMFDMDADIGDPETSVVGYSHRLIRLAISSIFYYMNDKMLTRITLSAGHRGIFCQLLCSKSWCYNCRQKLWSS